MLGKRSRPMISKISELLISGNRAVFLDVATSPKSPLELKIQSPRGGGVKNFDLGGGVGLGIVAALDKACASDVGGSEILARCSIPSPRPIRTDPIPVKNCCARIEASYEAPSSFEYYNYMTCHGPKNESFTNTRDKYGGNGFDRKSKKASIFCVSPPARCLEDTTTAFPVSDFLSSCHSCRKKLHGKDIYMYRGEKAFCSADCREKQIIIDDRKEQCRSEAKRSVDVSSSPYAQGNIFSTGILAI